ncbi:penicillin-binding protein activator [Rickettsiella endosymbiont of Aleochara curtula]|uniref:penicillin-binding protein activator n=1 Tax=Rickettsiella endosymbiont of Aleochara curtula TaxID=3077936 RepID=UPI00313CFD15
MSFSLMNRLCLSLGFLLISLGLTACASNSSHVPNPVLSNNQNPAFSTSSTLSNNVMQTIALLLPLQGPLANIGVSVKQGFLAAAEENGSSPRIILVDTSVESSIQAAYTQAIAKNAQIIVGPLLKPQVQSIAGLQTRIPILALNYLNSDISTPSELYQFGLSPLDEAQQAINHAWKNGKRSALIMTANGNWGSQIGEAFAQQWQALGGTVVGQLTLSENPADITKQMRHFLHFKPPHDRRTDFDVIFLASSPQIGRQVKPLLKFFYAGDIPVYATASIYSGIPGSQRLDKDLNQIIFCAAPWSLANSSIEPNLYQQLKSASPERFSRNSKYYALGIDAFHIIQQLGRLNQSQQQTLQGATGMLSLNSQHRIARQLPCAQFRNGNLVPID